MIREGIETIDELKVITVFHLMGLAMELFKVWKGSWSYPELAITRIGGVPLYSGFMYASVTPYLCQGWRRFNLSLLLYRNTRTEFSLQNGVYQIHMAAALMVIGFFVWIAENITTFWVQGNMLTNTVVGIW